MADANSVQHNATGPINPTPKWGDHKMMEYGLPLFGLGCVATVAALGRGLYFMNKGNSAMQQRYMRYRIGAQGATIFLIVGCMELDIYRRNRRRQEYPSVFSKWSRLFAHRTVETGDGEHYFNPIDSAAEFMEEFF